jgi:hypothetical protein
MPVNFKYFTTVFLLSGSNGVPQIQGATVEKPDYGLASAHTDFLPYIKRQALTELTGWKQLYTGGIELALRFKAKLFDK